MKATPSPLLLCVNVAVLFGCATSTPRAEVAPHAKVSAPVEVKEDLAPPEAEPSGGFVEREVEIGALRGTLTVPRGAGRWPTVLLIHDHGPMGRDGHVRTELGVELGAEVAVYREIAHGLARAGVASVRWDKRTCIEGAGPRCTYPREMLDEAGGAIASALVKDARDVRTWASGRPEVDPERIGVVGHGEGAWVGLALDAHTPLWSLALVAPTSHGLAERIDHQFELSERYAREALAAATPGAEADGWRVHVDALVDARASARAGFDEMSKGGSPERVAGIARATWEDHATLRVMAMERLRTTPTHLLMIHLPDDEGAPTDTAARMTGVRRDAPTLSITGVTRGLVDLEGEEAEVSRALILALDAFMSAGSTR